MVCLRSRSGCYLLIDQQAKPTLEGLPTELQIIILSQISDLDTLKSIVLSSPICHRVYLTVRHELLHNILKEQYGAILDLSEAITAIRSKGLHLQYHEDQAIAILDNWRRRGETRQSSSTLIARVDQPDGLEEIIKLLHLHKKLHFFLEDYTINVSRPSWIDPAQWEQELPIKMSNNEKRRFMRALCRLQIHANIFGPVEDGLSQYLQLGRLGNRFDGEKGYRLFFGAMPPWEYQEMGCVWSYLTTKYSPVFKKISDDLRDAMKSAQSQFFWDVLSSDDCPPSAVIDTVEDLKTLPKYTGKLTSRGPDFLYRVLHAEPVPQRNMLIGNIDTSHRPFIGIYIPGWDYRYPFTEPADRHEVRNFEQFWSTLPTIDQPNLGWRELGLIPHTPEQELEDALFEENEQNLEEKEWSWGYALWDDARLKEWKAPLVRDESLYARRINAPPPLLLTAP